MLNRFRDRFGTAGLVVSIMALVLALAGGAFAASGGLNAKQKKQVKAIAKQFAGKPGATGATGPAGPAGAKGDTGAKGDKGDKGDTGDNGKSVTGAPIAAAGACGTETGVKYSLDGTDTNVCNGSPWTAGGTLPPGETLTGTWGGQNFSASATSWPISFPLPVDPASGGPAPIFVEAGPETGCPGLDANGVAQADPGKLCVYGTTMFNSTFSQFYDPTANIVFAGTTGAAPTGTVVNVTSGTGGSVAFGTWAVTAAE